MVKLLTVFILQLLFGTCRLCILQNISADLRSVSPGENITLHCSISADYEISWYLQNSEEQMKLLVSAGRGKLDKLFSLSFNIKEDHYDIVENSSSVSLGIIGVNETDLGLYYCGGQNHSTLLHFGKPIRLTFTDENVHVINPSASPSAKMCPVPDLHWIINMILASVCSASVLINIICLSVICCRAHGKCCRGANAGDLNNKEEDLQYASIQHSTASKRAATGNTASTQDSVIYSGISS